jgi:hypothetical protein
MFLGVVWTVEDHLLDKPAHIRALYDAFEQAIAACGAYQTSVTKTAISFKGAVRGFAGATPRSKSLTGFLDLQEEVHESPFTRVGRYTSRLWVHRFVITDLEQLDKRFVALVKAAYEVGQGAHRS